MLILSHLECILLFSGLLQGKIKYFFLISDVLRHYPYFPFTLEVLSFT